MAENKETMRCRHSKLDAKVFRKIENDYANPLFDEEDYESCLKSIGEFLNRFLP
jgi:hypothetical protein